MKKAFTWIELMVVIAIIFILAALVIPAIQKAMTKIDKNKTRIEEEGGRKGYSRIAAKEGDFVYFYTTPSTTITGMVNTISRIGIGFPLTADILVQGTNGQPQKVEAINVDILHKVPDSAESWK